MITTIIYTIVCLVVLGLLFSVVLYLVAQMFKVEEDPRVDIVESLLPGANCGGCGLAGCRAFAEEVVKAPSTVRFSVRSEVMLLWKIAAALGQEAVKTEPRVAVIKRTVLLTTAQRPTLMGTPPARLWLRFTPETPAVSMAVWVRATAWLSVNLMPFTLMKDAA